MSSQAQETLAKRLTVGLALLVVGSLLIVGWALYRPEAAEPMSAQPVAATP